MSPIARRRGATAVLTAVLSAVALAAATACSSASGEPDTATTASPAATTAAGGDVQAACTAEIALNALEFPGSDPGAPAPTARKLQDFAADAEPLAATLRANVPAELINEVDVLDSVLATARRGQPIDYEGSGLFAAGQVVDAWMADNCGYPTLAVTNDAGTLTGLPASVPAGPVSITFANQGEPAKAGFVLLFAKVKDGATATAAGLADGTTDLESSTDIISAVQPQGRSPGYGLADLPAGRYLVVSPLGSPPDFAGGFAAVEFDVR
ncbi:hypothetical protein I6A84_19975 [Frankia sp. CNm7]|uniref:Uncharacterized protein n=1 Tax=Frankia nepalensis TaxID=1836974 RepID=A0A937RDQ2_9ACTN|nr:hypothetical protein [Frankia nepalensis]MBL7501278.1 hypothetical protein [Frankia nepalensis]MBL7510125.1 hypothetical protein [Frankia nepalensis]MBL7520304.1 hypothetical protein [Frankia nepalensis]MBL7627100.1 hypothetical protein [Frankia nepalensis]